MVRLVHAFNQQGGKDVGRPYNSTSALLPLCQTWAGSITGSLNRSRREMNKTMMALVFKQNATTLLTAIVKRCPSETTEEAHPQ